MRIAKGLFFALILLGLASAWFGRGYVIDAYSESGEKIEIDVKLGGLSQGVERTDLGSSPYNRVTPPEGSNTPIAFAPLEPQKEPEPVEIEIEGGEAELSGIVKGPEGPVPRAVVHLERVTPAGSATLEIVAKSDGSWRRPKLLGGRYRVRSWLQPNMWADGSQTFFLGGEESRKVDFQLEEIVDEPFVEFHARDEVVRGSQYSVALTVGYKSVNEAGLLALAPLPGVPVSKANSFEFETNTEPIRFTDQTGALQFNQSCSKPGHSKIAFWVGPIGEEPAKRLAYDLPVCVAPPPPPTVPPQQFNNRPNSTQTPSSRSTTPSSRRPQAASSSTSRNSQAATTRNGDN